MLLTTLVESFQTECITPYEVNQYIQKLNPNKSTGIDGIGPILLVEMQFLQPSLVLLTTVYVQVSFLKS